MRAHLVIQIIAYFCRNLHKNSCTFSENQVLSRLHIAGHHFFLTLSSTYFFLKKTTNNVWIFKNEQQQL